MNTSKSDEVRQLKEKIDVCKNILRYKNKVRCFSGVLDWTLGTEFQLLPDDLNDEIFKIIEERLLNYENELREYE